MHEVQIYTSKHGGAERVLEWYKIWQTNRKKKTLHVYMDFLKKKFRALLCLEALVVIVFTVFALYVQIWKGCHRLKNLLDSEIGVAV